VQLTREGRQVMAGELSEKGLSQTLKGKRGLKCICRVITASPGCKDL
jgi:hypothetical protein